MPENNEALELWLAVRTQWRGGGMGVIGLDYAEVRQWAMDLDIDLSPAVWGKIKALEAFELERCHATERNDKGRGGPPEAAG